LDLDVVTLSRAQFALTIMFHYLFPPLSIGLGALMVMMEGAYLVTGEKAWERATRFWSRVFAVNFAVGVATGIVMEFQFGTNWATYSRFVGDVFGSLLASEGIFAFFLESGFLAVLVFGWDRVGPRVHFFSTVMVFLGSVFSATWIVIANSWQQTPAGHRIVGEGPTARAEIVDFWAMVFNPSSVHRLVHVILGCFILGAFFVASVSAWHLLKGKHTEVSRRTLTLALVFGLVSSVAIGISGHGQAKMVAEHQPAKLAAFEGHFHTSGNVPLYAFGIPDVEGQRVRYGIGIPGGLSFMIHGDPAAIVRGLDQFPPEDRPPVVVPFTAYHLMVGLGGWFVLLPAVALLQRWRGRLEGDRRLLWAIVLTVPGPYLANQAGWVAAEVGRQPWVVYGLLRTRDAVSRSVTADQVLGSIIVFTILYLALFAIWLIVLNDKIQHGPEAPAAAAAEGAPPDEPPPSSLLDVAARRNDPASPYSMTEPPRAPTGGPEEKG
jgi:cytochrome d ubiquinol oxidase subunit I